MEWTGGRNKKDKGFKYIQTENEKLAGNTMVNSAPQRMSCLYLF